MTFTFHERLDALLECTTCIVGTLKVAMLNHLLRCARLIGGLDTASAASGHQAATSAILSGTCANALFVDTLIISLSIDRVRI